MNLKRLLCAAALTATALAINSCGGGELGGEALRWRTTIDLPMNFSRTLDGEIDWPSSSDSAGVPLDSVLSDSVFWDIGAEKISTASDFMDIVKKTTDQKISYSLRVANGTGAGLTFYGMIFGGGDAAADADSAEFRELVTSGDSGGGRVNILGPNGLYVPSNEERRRDVATSEGGSALCDLIMREKTLYWRWLVMVNRRGGGVPSDTGSVDIKLRIRFSGVNSFDSLFAP